MCFIPGFPSHFLPFLDSVSDIPLVNKLKYYPATFGSVAVNSEQEYSSPLWHFKSQKASMTSGLEECRIRQFFLTPGSEGHLDKGMDKDSWSGSKGAEVHVSENGVISLPLCRTEHPWAGEEMG